MARLVSRAYRALLLLLLALSLGMIFFYAPTEATMGPVQRIFYVHVSCAWVAFLCFLCVFISGIVVLATHRTRWDDFAASAAEVGVLYASAVLVTGPLWARPVWGIWWTWDARLTSMFVLWLSYVAFLALRASISDQETRARYASVLGIFGFLNVPLTYFSVRWWRTQHPKPVILGGEGSGLDAAMGLTLLVTWLALALLAALFIRERMKLEELKRDREAVRR